MPDRQNDRVSYSPPIRGRLAARHTLLAEFYMGWSMVCLGYSGLFGGDDGTGLLHQMLERMNLDNDWGVSFGLIGVFMIQCSLIEFFWGRGWDDVSIMRLAWLRRACAFWAVFLWLFVAYLQVTTDLSTFKYLTMAFPVNVLLAGYFFYENSRVHFFTRKWNAEASAI